MARAHEGTVDTRRQDGHVSKHKPASSKQKEPNLTTSETDIQAEASRIITSGKNPRTFERVFRTRFAMRFALTLVCGCPVHASQDVQQAQKS